MYILGSGKDLTGIIAAAQQLRDRSLTGQAKQITDWSWSHSTAPLNPIG
jgi:hypothetical protein